jgi:undecaprenyl-diphosphatase
MTQTFSLAPRRRVTLLALMALLAFLTIAAVFGIADRSNRLDSSVSVAVHRFVGHRSGLGRLALDVTWLGSTPVLVGVLVVAAAALMLIGRADRAIALLVTSVSCDLVVGLVKVLLHRPRPLFTDPIATTGGFSFPSGHAANSVVVYGAAWVLLLPALQSVVTRHLVRGGVVVLVVAIGLSRVAIGVHWVSDVAGGSALGLAAVQALRVWCQRQPHV